MQASFFERIGAYFIDIIVISLIISIITYAVPVSESTINEDVDKLIVSVQNGELSRSEYMEEYQRILYVSQKENISNTILELLVSIAYFIVFQYLNKGKTIGKLILGTKVVDANGCDPPTFYKMLLRELIPFGILSTTLSLILINTLTKSNYLMCYETIRIIESIFIFASLILISRKRLGLHDILSKTMVIKEERRWIYAWIYWSRINSPWESWKT